MVKGELRRDGGGRRV